MHRREHRALEKSGAQTPMFIEEGSQ